MNGQAHCREWGPGFSISTEKTMEGRCAKQFPHLEHLPPVCYPFLGTVYKVCYLLIFFVLLSFLKGCGPFPPRTCNHPFIPSEFKKKKKKKKKAHNFWSAGKSTECYSTGPKFSSQHSHQTAHNLLWLQLWRIWCPLLTFGGNFTLMHIITHRHTNAQTHK